MYALELTLDSEATRAVCAAWASLHAAGLDTPARLGFEPHITLGLYAKTPEVFCRRLIDRVADEGLASFEIGFRGIDAFRTDPGVVFLGVQACAPLVALHRRVQEDLLPRSVVTNRYYGPALWVPHVTLAERIRRVMLPRVESLAEGLDFPPTARFGVLRLLSLPPARTIYTRILA